MSNSDVAAFTNEFTRYLNSDAAPVGPLPTFAADPVVLVPLYPAKLLTSAFDARAVAPRRAWTGDGASLIEAVTDRRTDHTTADDARRYRDNAEVAAHWPGAPTARLRQNLVAQGAWSLADKEQALAQAAAEVDRGAEIYLQTGPQLLAAMFNHLFAAFPAPLRAELEKAVTAKAEDA